MYIYIDICLYMYIHIHTINPPKWEVYCWVSDGTSPAARGQYGGDQVITFTACELENCH